MDGSQKPLFPGAVREIKKHSSIVQMGNVTTLQERKAMNALIRIAKDQLKTDPDQRLFSCDIGILKRIIGSRDSDNGELKATMRNLQGLQFEFNILHKDDIKQWKLLGFMSEVTITEEGRGKATTIAFEFPTSILEAIKNPNMFVKLDLVIIRGLESKHSIALYEVLKDYLNLGKFRFNIEDFKKLMGIRPGQYSNFTMLRQRVLEVATKEINDKTDIEAGYELDKQGRQVTGVVFRMRPKPATKAQGSAQAAAVREQLLYYGLSAAQAGELLQQHDTTYLQANIAIVKEQVAKGAVKSPAAYLLKALQADFRPQATAYTVQQQEQAAQAQKEAAAKAAADKRLEGVKTAFTAERKERVSQALQSLPEEKTAWYKAAFLGGLSAIFKKYHKDKGREHPMLQAQRYGYLAKELLPPHFHSQDNYIAFKKANG